MIDHKIHITLIGPRTNIEHNLIGGATISFDQVVSYAEKEKYRFNVVNTKKYFGKLSLLRNYLSVFLSVIFTLPKTDVVFMNTSRGGVKYLAPFLYMATRITGKYFVFRPFGGNLKEYVSEYNIINTWIFNHTTLKSDLIFLQTNSLINYFLKKGAKVEQLPTSRYAPALFDDKASRTFDKRFIFIGSMIPEKGIDLIEEASIKLGDKYAFALYGPFANEEKKNEFIAKSDNYKGHLKTEEVYKTLSECDVLLLPTYYDGEGYPGVIIEAFAMGKPVIASAWKSIPEIVEDGKNGFLITPNSTEALLDGIKRLESSNYSELSKNARKTFDEKYNIEKVLDSAFAKISGLII